MFCLYWKTDESLGYKFFKVDWGLKLSEKLAFRDKYFISSRIEKLQNERHYFNSSDVIKCHKKVRFTTSNTVVVVTALDAELLK